MKTESENSNKRWVARPTGQYASPAYIRRSVNRQGSRLAYRPLGLCDRVSIEDGYIPELVEALTDAICALFVKKHISGKQEGLVFDKDENRSFFIEMPLPVKLPQAKAELLKRGLNVIGKSLEVEATVELPKPGSAGVPYLKVKGKKLVNAAVVICKGYLNEAMKEEDLLPIDPEAIVAKSSKDFEYRKMRASVEGRLEAARAARGHADRVR